VTLPSSIVALLTVWLFGIGQAPNCMEIHTTPPMKD
jgi:hypothetical protein